MSKRRYKRKKPQRKSLRITSQKQIKVGGMTYVASVSKTDVPAAPKVLKSVKKKDLPKYIDRKTRQLEKRVVKGRKKYVPVKRYIAPEFARQSKQTRANYSPYAPGRADEHYLFFPVFEFTITQSFDFDDMEENDDEELQELDQYETLRKYFTTADAGSRASWSLRPPSREVDSSSGYAIRQTLRSFRRYGLDKKQLAAVIREANDRMNGYAVVTAVRGVWRSQYSEEQSERSFQERRSEKMKKAKARIKKPQRVRGKRR